MLAFETAHTACAASISTICPAQMQNARATLLLPEDEEKWGLGVRVALIDSGVDVDHPDLRGRVNLRASKSVMLLSNDIIDRHYHGTHIAGIVAGSGAASQGKYKGIAPDAELIILKAANTERSFEGNVAAAIQEAIAVGADIINFSAGFSPWRDVGPPPWVWPTKRTKNEDAFETAIERGILCVIAAGNDGPEEGSINRPGGLSGALTVGALDRTGKAVWDLSSRGPHRSLPELRRGGQRRFEPLLDKGAIETVKPDLVAPGEDIVAPRASQGIAFSEDALLDPRDTQCPYLRESGSSQATAVVTGLAARVLYWARRNKVDLGPNPGRTLKSLLMLGASPLTSGGPNDYGSGIPTWSTLSQALREFASSESFRDVVLNGGQLRLLL